MRIRRLTYKPTRDCCIKANRCVAFGIRPRSHTEVCSLQTSPLAPCASSFLQSLDNLASKIVRLLTFATVSTKLFRPLRYLIGVRSGEVGSFCKVSKTFPPLENFPREEISFSKVGNFLFQRWKLCFPRLESYPSSRGVSLRADRNDRP